MVQQLSKYSFILKLPPDLSIVCLRWLSQGSLRMKVDASGRFRGLGSRAMSFSDQALIYVYTVINLCLGKAYILFVIVVKT